MKKSKIKYGVRSFKWDASDGLRIDLVAYRLFDTVCCELFNCNIPFGIEEERAIIGSYGICKRSSGGRFRVSAKDNEVSPGLGVIIRKDSLKLSLLRRDLKLDSGSTAQVRKIVKEEIYDNIYKIKITEKSLVKEKEIKIRASERPFYFFVDVFKTKMKRFFRRVMPKECVFTHEDFDNLCVKHEEV
jgi:hypothetical protein